MNKVMEVLAEKIESLESIMKCLRMENDELLSEKVQLEQNKLGMREEIARLKKEVKDVPERRYS